MCSAYSTSKALPPLSVVLRQTASSPETQPIPPPPPPSLPLPLTSPSTHSPSFAPLTQVLVADNVLPFPTNTADSRSMTYSSHRPSIQDSSVPTELFTERTSMFPQSTSQTLPQTISASRTRPKRRRASLHQLSILESVFQRTFYPGTAERLSLARQLGMTPRRVQIWFQNQRQKLVKREHELQRTNSTDESDSEEGTQDSSPDKASMDSNDENSNGNKEGSEEEEEEGNEEDGVKNCNLSSLLATTATATTTATVSGGSILPMRQEHLRRKGKKPVTVMRPAVPLVASLSPNWATTNTLLNPDNQPASSEFHPSGTMNNPHNLSVDIPAPLPSIAPASAYPAIPLRSPSYRHRPYDLVDQGVNGGNRRRAASLVDRPAAMYSALSASSPLRRLSENSVTANSKPRPLTPPGPVYRTPMNNDYGMEAAYDYPPSSLPSRARVSLDQCYQCTSNHSPTGHHYHYPHNSNFNHYHSYPPDHSPNLNPNHSSGHPLCRQPMRTSSLPESASHLDPFSICSDGASNQYESLSSTCPTASTSPCYATPPMPFHSNSAPHVMKAVSRSPQDHYGLPAPANERPPIHFS